MDNEATPVQLILLIEFGPDGVRATLLAAADDEPEPVRPNWESLTKRERQVLRLLADGMRNEQVAVELSISPLTVRTHVRRAMKKLEADTRTQAVARALRESLIS